MTFELHPRLAADTLPVGTLPLCHVLLMNDATYPWCILVPARGNIREIHALDVPDRQQLMHEIAAVSAAMETALHPDKMNVAALGNQVPQLHVHVIARFGTDPAWPNPVWGHQPARPYTDSEKKQQLATLQAAFEPIGGFVRPGAG